MDLRVGAEIGTVVLVNRTGGGAYGEVWEGRDRQLGRRVAIKVLDPKLARNTREKQRFLTEGRLLSQVVDEHVVTVHAVSESPPAIQMEFLDGITLREALSQGPLEWDRAREVLLQLCHGLEAVHAAGLVHCDLKPENAMVVTRRGREICKLLDFGLARPAGSLAMSVIETSDDEGDVEPDARIGAGVRGTAAYMAPEQFLGQRIDARTDVYGLGALAYELITGFPMFPFGSCNALRKRHLDEDPDPPSLIRDTGETAFKANLDELLMTAVAKESSRRFSSVKQFRLALERMPKTESPSSRPVAARSSGRRIKAAAATLVVSGVLTWGTTRATTSPASPTLQTGLASRLTRAAVVPKLNVDSVVCEPGTEPSSVTCSLRIRFEPRIDVDSGRVFDIALLDAQATLVGSWSSSARRVGLGGAELSFHLSGPVLQAATQTDSRLTIEAHDATPTGLQVQTIDRFDHVLAQSLRLRTLKLRVDSPEAISTSLQLRPADRNEALCNALGPACQVRCQTAGGLDSCEFRVPEAWSERSLSLCVEGDRYRIQRQDGRDGARFRITPRRRTRFQWAWDDRWFVSLKQESYGWFCRTRKRVRVTTLNPSMKCQLRERAGLCTVDCHDNPHPPDRRTWIVLQDKPHPCVPLESD